MIITEKIAYADLFTALEPATINSRIRDGNAFVKRVMAQPKLWVIGGDSGLGA
jgi:hypothetical protein